MSTSVMNQQLGWKFRRLRVCNGRTKTTTFGEAPQRGRFLTSRTAPTKLCVHHVTLKRENGREPAVLAVCVVRRSSVIFFSCFSSLSYNYYYFFLLWQQSKAKSRFLLGKEEEEKGLCFNFAIRCTRSPPCCRSPPFFFSVEERRCGL